MDLPQIGAHCAWKSCNVLDFLPIACQCSNKFCSEHISPDLHACPLLNVQPANSTFTEKIRRCQVEQCSKPSAGSVDGTCPHCHKLLCPDHRFSDLHDCPSLIDKLASAKPPHRSTQPPTPVIPTRKPPRDPVKLAQWRKVELMKMRHRANPADPKDRTSSVSVDQRIHVKIVKDNQENVFWLRKGIVTGKALDLLVGNMKLIFPENAPLQVSAFPFHGGEGIILQNNKPLADQIEDGSILTIQTRQ